MLATYIVNRHVAVPVAEHFLETLSQQEDSCAVVQIVKMDSG
jgi:hypothetical protein